MASNIKAQNDDVVQKHGEQESGHPKVQVAPDGAGPLLQRTYEGIIDGSRMTPEEITQTVLADFPRFSPENLAAFTASDPSRPLQVGDELAIRIKGAGNCDVVVARVDPRSFTLRTLEGHMEAGRITFGALQNEAGELIFRIRSRARSSDMLRYIGYRLFGKGMQTRVWVTFVERVAEASGGTLRDGVQTETKEVEESLADIGGLDTPTFVAH